MDTIKTIGVSLATALVVVLGFGAATGGDNLGYGVTPGISMFPASFTNLTQGGAYYATSTAVSASTLSATEMDDVSYIKLTPTGAAHTLTLPATSTLSNFAPNPGDFRTIIIQNGATAATNTTIAAGTGMDLQEPDGQNVVIGQSNYAILTFYRQSNGDMVVTVDETIPAD